MIRRQQGPELAAEAWWVGDHSRDVAEVVAEVLAQVREATINLPE